MREFPPTPMRQVRAVFDATTITVYQAYSAAIAVPAVAAQTFVAPFGLNRMTWIKPSFLWMMYRSSWGTAPGQEHVLAITITRAGFEAALSAAVLSHFDPDVYTDVNQWQEHKNASPVRVQWDPERDITLNPLPWRSIQIGLAGPAVRAYRDQWILAIDDVTDLAHKLAGSPDLSLLPDECPYPLPDPVARAVGASR